MLVVMVHQQVPCNGRGTLSSTNNSNSLDHIILNRASSHQVSKITIES